MRREPAPEASYRLATPDDVPEMADVFLESLLDLHVRKGIRAEVPSRAVVCRDYSFVLTTGSFHVAEAKGTIVLVAGAVMRGSLWYLSAFWARPAFAGKGLGTRLLRGLHAEALEQGAQTFATWSSPDLPAIAAYLRLGMRPWDLMLRFDGTPRRLSTTSGTYETRLLDPEVAMGFDNLVRATPRPADHALLGGLPGAEGRQVIRGNRVVGYYYVNGGWIGPAAWLEGSEYASEVLSLAFRGATEMNGSVGIALPGRNSVGVDMALAAGLPLVSTAHLMASASFGDLTRYVPSGPLLF